MLLFHTLSQNILLKHDKYLLFIHSIIHTAAHLTYIYGLNLKLYYTQTTAFTRQKNANLTKGIQHTGTILLINSLYKRMPNLTTEQLHI